MKLYLITQNQNNDCDTYDSAVVAAPDEETARQMHPETGEPVENWHEIISSWCNGQEYVTARYIGEATDDIKQGVICASFNAS